MKPEYFFMLLFCVVLSIGTMMVLQDDNTHDHIYNKLNQADYFELQLKLCGSYMDIEWLEGGQFKCWTH